MAKSAVTAEANLNDRRPFFKGYPYLVIRIVPSLSHINLLSNENSPEELMRLAQVQTEANKLEVCLVLNENSGLYFSPKREPCFSDGIPKGGFFITDRVPLSDDQRPNTDLLQRKKDLDAFIQGNKSGGCIRGNPGKGGRAAKAEECIRLRGLQENGLPKGLMICHDCGGYRGECLDPNVGLVVTVSCSCDNDNLCAYCGKTLYNRKLDSNYYNPEDGNFWYVPSFAATSHRCPEDSKAYRAPSVHLKM